MAPIKLKKQAPAISQRGNPANDSEGIIERTGLFRSDSSSLSFNDRSNSTSDLREEITRSKRTTASTSTESATSSNEFTLNKLNILELGLYGRQSETKILEAAFENLSVSKIRNPALVAVGGYSGTGKSTLVENFKGFIDKKGGIYGGGKYDLESRVAPYTAFRMALSSIIAQLLKSRNEDELLQLRKKTKEVLGDDWRVLSDICPNLNDLLGEVLDQLDSDGERSVEGREGALRLRFYFQSLIRCLCSPSAPLVIVLDDVQWADIPSFELMEAFLCDALAPPALLIVTYRDNEVDAEHPFSKLVAQMKQKQIPLEEITLRGLDIENAHRIVSTVLRMEESDETHHLAELARSKTDGNPFFLLQFLRLLIDEHKLTYNFGTLRWYWNLDDIKNLMVTENVAAFLAARMMKLDQENQVVLQVAACLGRSFEQLDLVDIVVSLVATNILPLETEDSQKVKAIIQNLVEVGMLECIGTELHFAHDQIQAAAGASIPIKLKDTMKYHIAKYFKARCYLSSSKEHELFLAASLSESGVDSERDLDERLSFAGVNLRASQHAIRRSAFDAAGRYADIGIAFLGSNRWDKHYDLATKVESIAVEAAYCSGNLKKMENHMEEVLQHGASIDDKIHVYRTRLASYSVQERFEEGICCGLVALKELGFKAPCKNPSILTVTVDLLRTKREMGKHTLQSLISLPLLSDKKRSWAMGVVDWMGPMTYMSNKKLFLLLVLRSVVWSSKFGINEHSIRAFAIWGSFVHTVFGDIERGIMLAEASLQLTRKIESPAIIPGLMYIIYGHIYHWKHDLRASIQPSWYGYVKGMEVGRVEEAMHNLGQHDYLQYETGSRSLDALLIDFEAHVNIMQEYNQEAIRNYCLCILQMIYKLVGKDDNPLILSGSVMNGEEMLRIARESKNAHLEAWAASAMMQLAYLFGVYEVAGRSAEMSKSFGVTVMEGFCMVPRHFFITALTAISLYRKGIGRRKNWSRARKVVRKMKQWQSRGNVNVVHMTSLLDAELAAAKGDNAAAAESYKSAIRRAGRNGFLHDTALAHEKAAEFYLSCKDTYWAAHHISEAIQCFQEWRADAKVSQLRRKYQHLLPNSDS